MVDCKTFVDIMNNYSNFLDKLCVFEDRFEKLIELNSITEQKTEFTTVSFFWIVDLVNLIILPILTELHKSNTKENDIKSTNDWFLFECFWLIKNEKGTSITETIDNKDYTYNIKSFEDYWKYCNKQLNYQN